MPELALIIGFLVFFLIIALTLVLGGVSRKGDKRVVREGRVTPEQRLPTDKEREAQGY
jgi:hypothetical protein